MSEHKSIEVIHDDDKHEVGLVYQIPVEAIKSIMRSRSSGSASLTVDWGDSRKERKELRVANATMFCARLARAGRDGLGFDDPATHPVNALAMANAGCHSSGMGLDAMKDLLAPWLTAAELATATAFAMASSSPKAKEALQDLAGAMGRADAPKQPEPEADAAERQAAPTQARAPRR